MERFEWLRLAFKAHVKMATHKQTALSSFFGRGQAHVRLTKVMKVTVVIPKMTKQIQPVTVIRREKSGFMMTCTENIQTSRETSDSE